MADHAEVVRLAKSGMKPMVIAHRLEVHPNTVYNILRGARRKGDVIPLFSTSRSNPAPQPSGSSRQQISLPAPLLNLLQREAERRNMATTEVAQRLLEDALLGSAVSHD